MHEVLIGRQPIYNRELEVIAYELLYRTNDNNSADFCDSHQATGQMLANALIDIGLDNLVGDRLAYINLTRDYFTDEHVLSLDKDRIVLEILESIEPDAEFIETVRRHVSQGYRVALDDFVYNERFRPLVEICSVVKLDIRMLNREDLLGQIAILRNCGVQQLLAEKIETHEEFELCKELGFDLFQGYFLSRPNIVRNMAVTGNQLAMLGLLTKLRNPAISLKELASIISQDVELSYRLLQFCNSSAVGISRRVESILQAVTLLGVTRLRMMVTLLTLKGLNQKPKAIVQTAILRARMCELLGIALKEKETDSFHLVGLFSALDALIDRPLGDILQDLPLRDEVKQAILHHQGRMGEALHCVLAMERTAWEDSKCAELSSDQVQDAYLQAIAATVQGDLAT